MQDCLQSVCSPVSQVIRLTAEAKGLQKGGEQICKKLGSYIHKFRSSKKYIGKGTTDRMRTSAKQLEQKTGDKLKESKFEPSKPNTDTQAFKDEAKKIRDGGGLPSDNLYNKINSPGEKMLPPPEK